MARESGSVAEDYQPVVTDEKADTTAGGSQDSTAGPEGEEKAEGSRTARTEPSGGGR